MRAGSRIVGASAAALILLAGGVTARRAGDASRFPVGTISASASASAPGAARGPLSATPSTAAKTRAGARAAGGSSRSAPVPGAPALRATPAGGSTGSTVGAPATAPTRPDPGSPAPSTTVGAPAPGPVPTTIPPPVSLAAPFVHACGTQLCDGSVASPLFGGSTLGGLGDPDGRIALAAHAHLNIVRVVNFLDEKSTDIAHAPYDAFKWARVDHEIATARRAGLHVILDLSTYRNLLANNGVDPYTVDWDPFLAFVTARVNSATGVRYRDDPTIAIIAIAGEVEPLTTPGPTTPTTAQLTAFYARTISELHLLDRNHLVSSGGLLQLDWNSGIDWRAIFALPGDDVPAIHVYSSNDETRTLPAVAAYSAALGKPWIIEEFGFRQTVGDAARAADFQRVFDEAANARAAGVLFWNVGPEIVGVNGKTETYDVNPMTPLTYAVVVANRGRW